MSDRSWRESAGVLIGYVGRRRRVSWDDVSRLGQALRRRDRTSAVRGAVDGAYVAVTLKRRGLRPLLPTGAAHPEPDAATARRIAESVDAGLGVLPGHATCLRRSVTLLRELDRLGLGSTLHIGVRTTNGPVEAHAWVQVAGEVVNDDPEAVGTFAEIAAGRADRLLQAFR